MTKSSIVMAILAVGVVVYLVVTGVSHFFGEEARVTSLVPSPAAPKPPSVITTSSAPTSVQLSPAPNPPSIAPGPVTSSRPPTHLAISFDDESTELTYGDRSQLVHAVRTARETIEAVEVIVHKPLSAPATNERAESVHRALLASGIPESRITIKEGEFDGSTAIEVEIVRRRE